MGSVQPVRRVQIRGVLGGVQSTRWCPLAERDKIRGGERAPSSPSRLVVSRIAPLCKRDFLADLPIKFFYHILSFFDHPRMPVRIACVSRKRLALLQDK